MSAKTRSKTLQNAEVMILDALAEVIVFLSILPLAIVALVEDAVTAMERWRRHMKRRWKEAYAELRK